MTMRKTSRMRNCSGQSMCKMLKCESFTKNVVRAVSQKMASVTNVQNL